MKIDRNSRAFQRTTQITFALCMVLVFWYLLVHLSSIGAALKTLGQILAPFVWGFVIAYLLFPILAFSERSLFGQKPDNLPPKTLHRVVSLLVTYFLFVCMLGLFFYLIVPSVASSLYKLATVLPSTEDAQNWLQGNAANYLKRLSFSSDQINVIISAALEGLSAIIKTLSSAFPAVISFAYSLTITLKNIILGLIISVYVLAKKELFLAHGKKLCYALFGAKNAGSIVSLGRYINLTVSRFISAKILDSLIIGLMCFVGMVILRMPYAPLISLVVGVTNIIPYFGPIIGAVPGVLILLLMDPGQALVFIIFVFLLQQFDGNILGPKLLGDSVGISAFWIIFAILVGGGLFGVVGMLLGVPLFAVVYMLFKAYLELRLENRHLPAETECYMGKRDPQEIAQERHAAQEGTSDAPSKE